MAAIAITWSHGTDAESLSRPKRQYSGYSDVGYRQGAALHRGPAKAGVIKSCVDIHEIANGQAVCRMSGCRLRCIGGFSFIETKSQRSRTVMLSCDRSTGQLMLRDQIWTPEMTLCAPVCHDTCQNGGTCVAPDKCACTGPYTGDTCTEEPMLGDQPYRGYQPNKLAFNQRRVECEPGTRMPDGSTSVTLNFRDNSWFFPDGRLLLGVDQVTCEKGQVSTESSYTTAPEETKPTKGLPNPEPLRVAPTSAPSYLCNPSCQNGGQCVYTDTCSCPRGYWGPTCQVNTCTYPRFQNNLNASLGGTLKKMKFECHPGHHTRRGADRVIVLCRNGLWKLPSGRLLVEDDVKCFRD